MKRFTLTLTVISIMLAYVSCKKEVQDIVQKGTWRITMFIDSGKDELYHFTGYNFTFRNGTVTATNGISTVTGTYSVITDSNQNKFILNFGTTVPFDELNDDWKIVEQTSQKIRLEDVSGGSGDIDLLTFEKN